ncbi:hypothetical protein K488DRAFT_67243 [Vararia minispora EC-137]|uniref:Uncharacterized protein n=1 Tax=Vararia minispora EC-137 TaxID=1314806 RepID=A0ACB8QZM3_9AGAM|nr:hypothetical protein K488DRAFT_67243 [Vararia minispora EC-137]
MSTDANNPLQDCFGAFFGVCCIFCFSSAQPVANASRPGGGGVCKCCSGCLGGVSDGDDFDRNEYDQHVAPVVAQPTAAVPMKVEPQSRTDAAEAKTKEGTARPAHLYTALYHDHALLVPNARLHTAGDASPRRLYTHLNAAQCRPLSLGPSSSQRYFYLHVRVAAAPIPESSLFVARLMIDAEWPVLVLTDAERTWVFLHIVMVRQPAVARARAVAYYPHLATVTSQLANMGDIVGCCIELGKCFSICWSDITGILTPKRGAEKRPENGPDRSGTTAGSSTVVSSQPTTSVMTMPGDPNYKKDGSGVPLSDTPRQPRPPDVTRPQGVVVR